MRWSPEQQIWRKFVEAVEVMGPDKLIACSGGGWMGGAGDQAETGCVPSRYAVRCSPSKRCRSAHCTCDILVIKYQTTLSRETKFSGANEERDFPCSVDHEQEWQPHPVDPYSAMCTYLHLSLCGVMGGRKLWGRPAILPAIYIY